MSHLKSMLLLVISIGFWQLAAASSDAGTLLVGVNYWTACSPTSTLFPYYYGFSRLMSLGSYSPTGLTGGKTEVEVLDPGTCTGSGPLVTISGFSQDPGQSWLSSVKCGSVTNTGTSAKYYSYSSGTASWLWTTDPFGFSSKVGSNVGCTMVHN